MGALKTKLKLTLAEIFRRQHGYLVVQEGEKPPRREKIMLVKGDGTLVKYPRAGRNDSGLIVLGKDD